MLTKITSELHRKLECSRAASTLIELSLIIPIFA